MRRRDKRKRVKSRNLDRDHAMKIRDLVVRRDGGRCRFPEEGHWWMACDGPIDWAHRMDWRRSKTRGQDPEKRHTTQGSMCLCRRHHEAYDRYELIEEAMDKSRGADGLLRWAVDSGDVLGEG